MEQINVKMIEEKQVACIFHAGSTAEIGEDMSTLITELVNWAMKNGVQMAGAPFTIHYSSPEEISRGKLNYEVGFPFVGEARAEGDITIKTIPAQQVISAIHKGSYRDVGPVYAALMEYAAKNGYEIAGAPMELYLNNPMEVSESELLTEVQFPVVKQ